MAARAIGVKGWFRPVVSATTVLLGCVCASGFVSIHERGLWPADWPSRLEPYRAQARTFDISTGVHERVYEIRFETTAEFERIWPTILQLRSPGAPLRVRSIESSNDGSAEGPAAGIPVVRIYAPDSTSSSQKPGGEMLPVGPPWPQSAELPDGSLPEYVAISRNGTTWIPVIGQVPHRFRHRARIEIELVADGRILDFNEVLVPPGIPIIDNRQSSGERGGTIWYISPSGKSGNAGTADAPWDLASALAGERGIGPGDTVRLLEGAYRRRPNELFEVRLEGTAARPIDIRPAPGHRVRIDGGLSVVSPSAHLWIFDLEIFVSEPQPESLVSAGSHPPDLERPWGGLHMHGGRSCKYVNLVIHHCNQGISCWKDEIDPEIYGCILYANGWMGADRGHGHAIYTQNDQGVKIVSNCIMTCPYEGSYTVHAYGSERAYVNNYLFTENICYGEGPFLVGGGRPSQGIRVFRNCLYGVDMRLGYTAPYNEDCEVFDNVVVNGRLETTRYRTVMWDRNYVLPTSDTPRTKQSQFILLPNKYDRNRSHLAVFNWDGVSEVAVDTAGFMIGGDTALLFNPEDPFGSPVAEAVCRDGAVRVPVQKEFTAFLVKVRRR